MGHEAYRDCRNNGLELDQEAVTEFRPQKEEYLGRFGKQSADGGFSRGEVC